MNLFAENISVVEQAIHLLRRMDRDDYVKTLPRCFNSSIGGHCRHIIDHFLQFIEGLDAPHIINYDARERNQETEQNLSVGLTKLETIAKTLARFQHLDLAIPCRVQSNGESHSWTQSSIGRELQFVLSHAIHHYAILGIMCHDLGITIDQNFGLAPSTLKHRESLVASASMS